jgi:Flp pilus assembly pilin Flp
MISVRLQRDEQGAATVEWTLLVGAFGLPMFWVFGRLLDLLQAHYGLATFIETLPFP